MNTRLLYFLLFVQLVFGAGLLVIGGRARDARKLEYLELTHRVTSGQGSEEDFKKLGGLLGPESDRLAVRALFGLPNTSANYLKFAGEKPESRDGDFWVYVILPANISEPQKPMRCFVVEFNKQGYAKGDLASVLISGTITN